MGTEHFADFFLRRGQLISSVAAAQLRRRGIVFFTSPHGYPGIAGNAGNRGIPGNTGIEGIRLPSAIDNSVDRRVNVHVPECCKQAETDMLG